MGSNRAKLITRCCYAAVSLIALSVMFWIAWCLFGLTVVQVSEPQRRAVVHYSPTPSTSSTPSTEETSAANAISKLPTTSSLELKGKDLAKGDFSPREKNANNATADHGGDSKPPPRSQPIGSNKASLEEKVVFGTVSSQVDNQKDVTHSRRVSTPGGVENRPEERNERRKTAESTPGSHHDISPTRAYVETRTESRVSASRDATDLPKRDDIQSSRRSEDKFATRDPEFERDETRRRSSLPDRDRHRYDDDLRDERGSKGKYHNTDRGRESDDRYSKGDTRVYPDDRDLSKEDEVRFSKERYPEDRVRKGDDDDRYDTRHRYRDERPRPPELDKGLEGRLPTKDDRNEERSRNGDRYRDRDDDRYRDRVDDRYRDRVDDRYRDRDDDKYRDRDDDRYKDRGDDKYRDHDDDKYKDRDDDKYRDRDDDKYRGRDDERYRDRDGERYRDRDDERYRDRDDERYRDRDDERYKLRDEERYTVRDDDRRRDEERYRSRGDEPYPIRGDDRYRLREDEKRRYRDDDRYRPPDDDERRSRDDEEKRYRGREDDRHRDYERHRNDKADPRDSPRRFNDDKEGYRPRTDDDKYVVTSLSVPRITDDRNTQSRSSSNLPVGDRKPTSSRYEHNLRSEETVTDYDIPERESSRSREEIPRLPRPTYDDEEKYRERGLDAEDRRPYRYEKDRIQISPTRSRDESSHSRIESLPKGSNDDRKYLDNQRNKPRDDDRYDADRKRSTVIQDSRSSFSTDYTSRRYIDDIDDRDKYRTKLPIESTGDSRDRREEVVLDHRSYASDDEYRKDSRRTDDDRNRRRPDDTRRRYENDESYSRRDQLDDDEYKSRIPSDYDRDRSRRRDRYDDESRRYDDRYDDRYSSRSEHSVSRPVRRYDTYRDEDEIPRRDPDRTVRVEGSRHREEISRPSLRPSSSTKDEDKSYSRDEYMDYKPSTHRRYDEDSSAYNNRDSYSESRRYSDRTRRPTSTREPALGSSMTSYYPKDTSDSEKRFQNPEDRPQSSRAPNDEFQKDDSDRSRGQVRPLSAKDVIEAANRQSDTSASNARKVFYPVFDPRLSNLTSPEVIQPGERRGTTITLRKKRSA